MRFSVRWQISAACVIGVGMAACGPRPIGGGTGGTGGSGGSAGVGGTGGSSGSGGLRNCNYDEGTKDPCGSFTSPHGVTIQLGPYGGQMDPNVGQGFENAVNANDTAAFCQSFGAVFAEDPTLTANLMNLRDLNLALYTVYHPALWAPGEKFPLITWGNGTCAQPEGYGALLRYVASQGFIVVAANSRFVANGAMTRALDFMFAANNDSSSLYYQRIDTSRVGAMGHSQGGAATIAAAADARVRDVIIFNGGTSASKPFLAVSGDHDIGNPVVDTYRNAVNAAPEGAFLFFHNVPVTGTISGHLTLMLQPERVVEPTAGWWKYMLKGDAAARALFVGASCGLCNRASDFEYGERGLP